MPHSRAHRQDKYASLTDLQINMALRGARLDGKPLTAAEMRALVAELIRRNGRFYTHRLGTPVDGWGPEGPPRMGYPNAKS
jgi:hypothetical protein